MNDKRQPAAPPTGDDFYRRLCANAAIALVATDAEYRIVSWNSAATELLGYEAKEMLGKPIELAVPENRRKSLRRLLQRTTRRQITSQFHIRLAGPADAPAKDLMVALSPIPSRGGTQGVGAWIVDETAARSLRRQLATAEKMASLGTLARGVAHHFNNILGGVTTFVDFAMTSGDPAAIRRALQMTAEAAARAAKITQSLLSFANADSAGSDMADLTEIVLTFAHLVERPLTAKHIKLQLSLNPVPIVAVEANRMHQVLGNLLTNAEEAMPEGGTVHLSITRDADNAILNFSDTGCGIRREHLPLVFEPFFTTKGLLSGGQKANPGLGLSVVHGIIVEMGGRIEVNAKPSQGAKFSMFFPFRPPANG